MPPRSGSSAFPRPLMPATSTSNPKPKKSSSGDRRRKYVDPTAVTDSDVTAAGTAATRGDTYPALALVRRLRSPDEVNSPKLAATSLPELARLWGLCARYDDQARYNGPPRTGEAWTWEPRCADHWFEWLVVTETCRPENAAGLIDRCLMAFRGAYFEQAAAHDAPTLLAIVSIPAPNALRASVPPHKTADASDAVSHHTLWNAPDSSPT